ncbi:transporter substrate-binding domain-containing protein [Salipaludibacillus aurantiacus]|uniref:Polar amino acid transport system substrate-binding protein n=1 Tax=Salipaludibacillus aurantiacus TaxID=1601833 RepID=A0A1H9T399_9BACI|nr:transporter substrate-binding domain-containing protein [Salipaludibacillus aurantiacus]SER91547.1 polar amino acid transport system substrate-binding protein [Salipaludibacillus aurantiacus]
MNCFKKKILPVMIAAGTILVISACGDGNDQAQGENSSDGQADLTLDGETFVYALSGEYRPFSYVDENGELTGFDVDIGMAIAEELGYEGEPYRISFSGIIPGLQDERYDAIIGSMGITEERQETVDFSDPYYISGAQVYVRPDSDIASIDDITEDTNVAVALATTYEDMIADYTTDVSTYDSDVVALQSLDQGRHDAVVTDRLIGLINIEEQGLNLEMAGDLIDVDQMGIAVKKGNEDLLEAINEALAAIKEDGTYLEISEKYFDEDISQE